MERKTKRENDKKTETQKHIKTGKQKDGKTERQQDWKTERRKTDLPKGFLYSRLSKATLNVVQIDKLALCFSSDAVSKNLAWRA
jgi:hypothetical protein